MGSRGDDSGLEATVTAYKGKRVDEQMLGGKIF